MTGQLRVTRQTLWDQFYPMVPLLTPTHQALRAKVNVLEVNTEETPFSDRVPRVHSGQGRLGAAPGRVGGLRSSC